MARKRTEFQPVVATANDLATGIVVFRRPDGSWSGEIAGAEIAEDEAAARALLARAQGDDRACRVVEPALIEIARDGGFTRPSSLRELIRASGPTIQPPRDR